MLAKSARRRDQRGASQLDHGSVERFLRWTAHLHSHGLAELLVRELIERTAVELLAFHYVGELSG